MSTTQRGYQRSWKNLLINKEYQLRFTMVMVALSAVLLGGLGFWVMQVANEATDVAVAKVQGSPCPALPVIATASSAAAALPPHPATPPSDAAPTGDAAAPSPTPALVATQADAAAVDAAAVDAAAAAPKRRRIQIEEATFALPGDYGERVVAHWQCRMARLTQIDTALRGATRIRWVLILTSFALVIGLGIFGIKMTHGVAGPLFKVTLYLRKMQAGRFDKVYNLRKGDQLVEFYDHFKRAHAALTTLQQQDVEALRTAIATASAEATPSPELLSALDAARALLAAKEKNLE